MGAPELPRLPITANDAPKKESKWSRPFVVVTAIFLIARFGLIPYLALPSGFFGHHSHGHHGDNDASQACHQAKPLLPMSFDVSALVEGQDDRIIEWLGGSVRIPTEIFDVMGEIDEDPRWDIFYKHAECEFSMCSCYRLRADAFVDLEKAFPLV